MDSNSKPLDHFWQCVACGNSVKHFLGLCWKCGAARPDGEVARQASLAAEWAILARPWSAREEAFNDAAKDLVDRFKRDIQRHLKRIELARPIVLYTAEHVEGARVVRWLGNLSASTEERSDATYLSDHYGEGYHGELHHADNGELVVFMLV